MYLSEIAAYTILIFTLIGTIQNPFIGVMAYYTLSFYRPQEIYWWALGGSNLSLYVALTTIISFLIKKQQGAYPGTKITSQDIFMFLLWLTSGLSCLASQNIDKTWPIYFAFSKVILFYFILTRIATDKKKLEIMIWIAIVCVGAHALRANMEYFKGNPAHITQLQGAVYADENALAMLFVTIIPFIFIMLLIHKNFLLKAALGILILIVYHGVLITYSRGGFLGMIVVGICCLLRTPKKWMSVGLLIIALPILLRLWGPSSRERIATVFVDPELRDASAQGRIEAWSGGFGIIQAQPLFGVGFGNYGEFVSIYNPRAKPGRVAHNSFIQIGAEGGVPTMFCFAFLIFGGIWDLQKLMKYYKNRDPTLSTYSNMILISILGYAACSIFLSIEMYEPFYYFVGLTSILKKMKYTIYTI